MKVFCHEHKRGFFAPRQSPIKCENNGHVLGELNFAGQQSEGKSSFPFQWQYCCNCEHFSTIDFNDSGLERCPVCTRRSSTLYLCDRCYTVSFESNTPLEVKNFTLMAEGAPSPCCPGCLHPASADLREHSCDEARVSFVTALNSCPICEERLDVGPSFPSSVAQYLKRTRSTNKLFSTFDYETGLFVPVEDGEFVLIRNNDETKKTFVIPRSPRLETLREFYELYQDYYHCAAPQAGEINISEPAVVVPMGDGWKILSAGLFSVAEEPKQKKVVTPVSPERPATPVPEQPQQKQKQVESDGSTFAREKREPEEATVCTYCDTLIEAKYAFCWKCGSARQQSVGGEQKFRSDSQIRPPRSRLIVPASEDNDEEPHTVQHEPRASLLQRRNPPHRNGFLSQSVSDNSAFRKSVLKLFVIGAVGLLLISVMVFAIRAMRTNASAQNEVATTSAPNVQTSAIPQTVAEPSPSVVMKPVSLRTPPVEVPEIALEQLRDMRRGKTDQSKILKNLSETESKYSDDYRFPYERARVVVINHKKNFHEEAFAALSRAAQKAISKGKSSEMLQNLNKDSDGDFQKLSHGRREWAQLQRALKSKNASVLPVNEGL